MKGTINNRDDHKLLIFSTIVYIYSHLTMYQLLCLDHRLFQRGNNRTVSQIKMCLLGAIQIIRDTFWPILDPPGVS